MPTTPRHAQRRTPDALLERVRENRTKDQHAEKELGLGQPASYYGEEGCDEQIALSCAPDARIVIAEVARWRVDTPVLDSDISSTFGGRIDVWGTKDGNPPKGVASATNTCGTPGTPSGNYLVRGVSIRVLVEPEARTIPCAFLTGDFTSLPGVPDVWTQNDFLRALSLIQGQGLLRADLLWGLNTWKAAYNFVNGYEVSIQTDHQDRIMQQPLTQAASIEPFAEAEAAGLSFASNLDRIRAANDRLVDLAGGGAPVGQFLPIEYKRLGSLTTGGGANFGDFAASTDADASATIYGGIGVPQNMYTKDPYIFARPMFWPRGQPMTINFIQNDNDSVAEFQRWMSLTGGAGGNAGVDLNYGPSSIGTLAGLMPTTPGATIMAEQTLDTVPVVTSQQVSVMRTLGKGGMNVWEVALIGQRVRDDWFPTMAKWVKAGRIVCPAGYGDLTSYVNAA